MTAIGKSVYASTIGDRLLVSTNSGDDWRDKSFNVYQQNYKYDGNGNLVKDGTLLIGLKPVYALGKINSTVVVSVGVGYINYKPLNSYAFDSSKTTLPGYQILCFAGHDGKIFAGNSMGQIFLSEDECVNWDWINPFNLSLYSNGIYSLEFNKSYIFAGTIDGIWRFKHPENITAVDEFNKIPTGYSLAQNYPNPFNPSTIIRYQIPVSGYVTLKVYDLLGKEVASLVNEYRQAGIYNSTFSTLHSTLSSGIYFYQLRAGKFIETKKLILLK
jgi:hypothetical protein